MIKHASLFSGIGGFDMAASWMGWQNIFNCEKDKFCRNILKYYWPNTTQYEDIYQFNATQYRGLIDVLSGGFPCQPFSQAGRRKGKNDDRYLWPETRRIITEVQPKWIVLENVSGLFTILEPESLSTMEVKAIELFCQDGEQEVNSTIFRLQRRVIGSIIDEIGAAGYILPKLKDGTPIILCVPAAAVNAPHRRDRTWFVASHAEYNSNQQDQHQSLYFGSNGKKDAERGSQTKINQGCLIDDRSPSGHDSIDKGIKTKKKRDFEFFGGTDLDYTKCNIRQDNHAVTDTSGERLEGRFREENKQQFTWSGQIPNWDKWPTQPPVCSRDDGVSANLDLITFSKWRSESIRAYGNAIVPQIALDIFKAIEAISNL